MTSNDIDLNDIADELLIVDKRTIEHLFSLDEPADCVALYMFFYKTAKWQGNRSIKANDVYIRKCLGWGAKRVTNTKRILEDAGMIHKVVRKQDGKITGHFIEVAYLLHHNTRNPLVDESTCGFGETNTNKEYIKYSKRITNNVDTKVSTDESSQNLPEKVDKRNPDIDEAFAIWEEVMGYPMHQTTKERYSVSTILRRKEMNLDKLRILVRLVEASQHDKYKRFTISCFTDLMYKTNDLMAWAREKQAQNQSNATTMEV
jgi:hypothetical protein